MSIRRDCSDSVDLRALVRGDEPRQEPLASRGLWGHGGRGAWRRDGRVRIADGGSAGISAAGTQAYPDEHQGS
jgi:hypothetical protein